MDREPDSDTTLIDLLYGEVDEAARAEAEARVAADATLSAELERMRALRGALRSWREDAAEAPARGMDELLAAARVQVRTATATATAREPAEKSRGLWERITAWMTPLMAHPGLAAAATLVVVAGVAGTMYMTGGVRRAEPMAAAPEEPQGAAPAEMAEDRAAAPAPEPSAATAPTAATAEPPREVAEGGGAGRGNEQRLEQLDRKPERRPTKARARSSAGADDLDVGGFAAGESDVREEKKRAEPRDLPSGGRGAATGAVPASPPPPAPPPAPVPSKPAAQPRAEPQPAPQSAPEPASDEAESASMPASKKESSSGSEVQGLLRAAQAAAKKGDCALVRKLSDRARSLDAAFYDRMFRTDRAIAACYPTKK